MDYINRRKEVEKERGKLEEEKVNPNAKSQEIYAEGARNLQAEK